MGKITGCWLFYDSYSKIGIGTQVLRVRVAKMCFLLENFRESILQHGTGR